MSHNKVYVGGLPFAFDESDLEEIFGAEKIENLSLIKDHQTGRSKGFAFITFTEQQHAEEAIREFNDKEFSGRRIKLSIAKENPKRRERF